MTRKPPNPRGNLVDTLRSGAGSIRSALSQLATRRKQPETPAPAARKPAPDGPRWGQLVLLDKVGQGMFGEVFRAWDLVLEREVALKLMRLADEDPVLLLEARMLARLRHPNVVTVYGVDRHDGRFGIWMELIEGETLAALVEQRGSFGAQEALLVGVDVCRALASAHQSGLLHRDIKAQNVMRERGGRIVLMDFGLGHETAAAEPADFGGTPLYMAPELLEGEPATVRSDLYAVGVLLFHLVTRVYPMEGSTVEELRAAHAAGEGRTLRDLRPDMPSEFSRVVEKAIAPDPSRRYATAGQMTAALENALGTRRFTLPISRRAFWRTASSLAATGAAAIWYLKHRPSAAVTAGASLLLSEISNTTGDTELNAVADVLRAQLAQSAHFNVLEPEQVKETLGLMTKPADQKLDLALAREVALRSKTPLVVYGTVLPLGAGYELHLVIERIEGQPRTPVSAEPNVFKARNKNGMFDALHDAANWIRQTAGEAAKDISAGDTPPEEATTKSWEALDFFSRGERFREQNRLGDAVSMYKQAALKDPGFALALARIAQLQGTQLHPAESFAHWRKAVQALDARHVTRREDYRIRSLYANSTADYQAADGLTGAWVLSYPADSRAHHYRALALRNLERFPEARDELIASERLHPTPETLRNLIRVDLLLGDHQEAASYAKDLHDGYEKFYGALSKVLSRDFAGAETDFASVLSGNDARLRSIAAMARAYLLAERGRQREAMTALDNGIAQDSQAGNFSLKARKLVAKAHLEWLGGRFDSARDLALRAANEDRDTVNQVLAGTLLARAGFAADASSLLARLNSSDEGRRFETARAILTAEAGLAEGHVPKALVSLEEANRFAPPIHPRAFWAYGLERAGRSGDALIAWRRIANAPALLWTGLHDDAYDLCLWSEALLKVAKLELHAGRKTEARNALDQFLEIRKDADPDDPLSAAARKLLTTP